MWSGVREPPRAVGGSAALPGLQTPELCYSLDVNALNFCRFSLLLLPADARTDERQALLAVPNLVESAYVRTLRVGASPINSRAARCRRTYGRSRGNRGCTPPSAKPAKRRRPRTCAIRSVWKSPLGYCCHWWGN